MHIIYETVLKSILVLNLGIEIINAINKIYGYCNFWPAGRPAFLRLHIQHYP